MKNLVRKGFSLVELIVVLVIIGILAAIAYTAYSALIAKSVENSARTTAQSIDREAVALGAGDNPQSGADDHVTAVLSDSGNGFSGSGPWTKGGVTVTAGTGNYEVKASSAGKTACVTYTPSSVVGTPGTVTPKAACA